MEMKLKLEIPYPILASCKVASQHFLCLLGPNEHTFLGCGLFSAKIPRGVHLLPDYEDVMLACTCTF